ncbi:MAG TPA: metallophosphatase domain-containing protein [Flavisolibacter sp.]
MRFVAISDTHCRHLSIRLPKGDVLLHAGDISYRGKKQEMIDFLTWMVRQDFQHKIFIAGNHDFYFEQTNREEIGNLVPKGITYLNDSGITVNGIRIWGSPVTPWYFRWAFNRQRGASIRKHWELIPPDTNLLLTHGPAYGILDMVINEQHAGCRDLLQRVQEIRPAVHVCGHIHESYGSTRRNGTYFINACVHNEYYELVNRPVVFDM